MRRERNRLRPRAIGERRPSTCTEVLEIRARVEAGARRSRATELLAFTARLALPATAALYEPKRLRLRVLAVAGRIVRTARRRTLKIDTVWPWAEVITLAHTRLCTLPVP